jgi:hypothetical protein
MQQKPCGLITSVGLTINFLVNSTNLNINDMFNFFNSITGSKEQNNEIFFLMSVVNKNIQHRNSTI